VTKKVWVKGLYELVDTAGLCSRAFP